MSDIAIEPLDLNELAKVTNLPSKIIIEIVAEGIIEPLGNKPENWQFNTHMVATTHKAIRLHRDLNIDWPGIALALNLIAELEQLRNENKQLQQRLNRFLSDN